MVLIEGIYGFTDQYSFLSNFEPCKVVYEGVMYPTVEHAYQAAKTLDPTERDLIRRCVFPGQAKRFGKKITVRDDWEKIKVDVMYRLLIQKFSREPFYDKLLATDDLYIEETNTWGDEFWGVCGGKGQNVLGNILMEIRQWLKEDKENE